MAKNTNLAADRAGQADNAKAQRRRFARVDAPQVAIAECGERYFSVNLIDLSSNGARISVSPALDVDGMTHLIIPDVGGRLKCEKVWQDGRTVGLRFLEKPYEVAQKMAASLRRQMVPLAID